MIKQFSTNDLMLMLPDLTYNVPFYGVVDLRIYVVVAIVFTGLLILFWLVQKIIIVKLSELAAKTNSTFDDAIVMIVKNIQSWVYVLTALYISLQMVPLSPTIDYLLSALFLLTAVWQVIEIATSLLDYAVKRFLKKHEDEDGVIDSSSTTTSHLVMLVARIGLWSLGLLFILSNLGIEVASLIAGLGIGGIAIALALQGVLSDLLASFSLYFDKPFQIGDFVVIGTDSGKVEKIGIKSTRIRTLQGQELVVSNTELTTARVENFKKMQERRIVTQFGITYETPQEKVKEVPGIVTRIFEALEGGRLNRVHFTAFGDSALIFEIVYHVESPDYTDYLKIQQSFNFELMERFAELGISFAYPTQTIYTKKID